MAHLWRGVIREYAARLPMLRGAPVVTLQEGGTPLIPCENLSELTGANVLVKFEGLNPTASFKDRGMTTAISVAKRNGAKAVICASTGNTSASAAAYATKAGMTCAVLVPDGKIAMGKLSQAVAHGATLIQVEGNFDDCLTVARKLAEAYPVELVNSVNPARIEGQKTAAFEVVDALGDAPDIHVPSRRQRRQHHGLLAGLSRVRHCDSRTRWRGARTRRHAHSADVGLPGRRRGADRARATRSTTPRPSPPPSGSATPRRGARPRQRATSRAVGSRRSPTRRSSPRTDCCRPARASSSSPARPRASPACSRRTAMGWCPRDAPSSAP